jgi:hypothetical protein
LSSSIKYMKYINWNSIQEYIVEVWQILYCLRF